MTLVYVILLTLRQKMRHQRAQYTLQHLLGSRDELTTWDRLSCQSSASSSSEEGTLISETEDPTEPASEAASSVESFEIVPIDESLVGGKACWFP